MHIQRLLLLCCVLFSFQLYAQGPIIDAIDLGDISISEEFQDIVDSQGSSVNNGSTSGDEDEESHPYAPNNIFVTFPDGTSDYDIIKVQEQLNATEIYNASHVGIRYWRVTFPITIETGNGSIDLQNVIDIQTHGSQSTNTSLGVNEIGLNYVASVPEPKVEDVNFGSSLSDPYTPLPNCDKAVFCTSPSNAENLKIAIIDTGISSTFSSPLLAAPFSVITDVRTDVNPSRDLKESTTKTPTEDTNGHGTKMTSIITKMLEEQQLNNIEIMPIKAAHGSGLALLSDIILALDLAIAEEANIVNISMGYISNSLDKNADFLMLALQAVIDNNILIVASAGNNQLDIATHETPAGTIDFGAATPDNPRGLTSHFYPASFDVPGMITIGASNCDNTTADFSNYGEAVDMFVPGVEVLNMNHTGDWVLSTGTSQAAAITTGITAQLAANQSAFNAIDIECAINKIGNNNTYLNIDAVLSQLSTCSSGVGGRSIDIAAPVEEASLQASYPNPNNGDILYVPFNIPSKIQTARIELFNLMGQQISSYSINERNNGIFPLEVNSLQNGVYLCALSIDGKRQSSQLFTINK